MKLKLFTLLLFSFILTNCKPRIEEKEQSPNNEATIGQSEKISDDFTIWVNAINNKNIETIKDIYSTDAVKVTSTDSILSSSAQIAAYYINQDDKIIAIESLFKTEANKNRGIYYELIKFKTKELKEYLQFVILEAESKKQVRAFEFTAESSFDSKKVDTTSISDKRNVWIKLCNAHNAENLVNQLYSENALYFNHRPLIQGRESLIKEYAYMNNDKYTLTLEPLILKTVNENIAYEIGQCKGSYEGKYILIWKKEFDGEWKIYIDSNV